MGNFVIVVIQFFKHFKSLPQNSTSFCMHFSDETFIRIYLRGCKYSLERTKEKIDMYFTIKAAVPEWYGNMDPEDTIMQELLDRG